MHIYIQYISARLNPNLYIVLVWPHKRKRIIIGKLCAAKAPAVHLTRHVAAAVEQEGAAAASARLGGLRARSDANAARTLERLANRFNMRMGVPISHHTHAQGPNVVTMPWLKPSDYVTYLMKFYPEMLLGGLTPGPDSEQLLETFWREFQRTQPTHYVFTRPERRWKRTIPLLLHGDGGRTQGKQPLECISMHPALGLDSAQQGTMACHCNTCVSYGNRGYDDPLQQRCGQKHNSMLSHFLLFAFPSKKYPRLRSLLVEMHRAVADDVGPMCRSGFDIAGQRFYLGILGYMGDAEYHTKFGALTRSYQHVGSRRELPCCHECLAGTPNVPFEDVSATALWASSINSSFPWTSTPVFSSIPYENWTTLPSRAPQFYRRDTFHVFRHGNLAGDCPNFLSA